MSVLVYDGKSLAADSHANTADLAFPFPKIWSLPGTGANKPCTIYGAVGPLPAVAALRQWVEQGMEPGKFPTQAGTDSHLVLLSKDKGLIRYKGNAIPYLHGHNKIAIGEGAPFAYGAMFAGATAEQAVAAAIHYSPHCNGKPEVLTL